MKIFDAVNRACPREKSCLINFDHRKGGMKEMNENFESFHLERVCSWSDWTRETWYMRDLKNRSSFSLARWCCYADDFGFKTKASIHIGKLRWLWDDETGELSSWNFPPPSLTLNTHMGRRGEKEVDRKLLHMSWREEEKLKTIFLAEKVSPRLGHSIHSLNSLYTLCENLSFSDSKLFHSPSYICCYDHHPRRTELKKKEKERICNLVSNEF